MVLNILQADVSDARIIHELMIQAFTEYKDEVPPSSALDETVQSITAALQDGEQAYITYMDGLPVGMIRFAIREDDVYFSRLSVIPKYRGHGVARELIRRVERIAIDYKKAAIRCKVRSALPKNISLYVSMGYTIYEEEVLQRGDNVQLKVVSMEKKLR
ncbi:GNAT family N-acetyltransferase [Sporosarcina sp. CAU 1771]